MEPRDDEALRRAYLNLDPEELQLLAALEPLLEKHAAGFVTAFYRHLLSFEPTRALLSDPEVKERLLAKQRGYLLSLARPTFDDDFLAERRRIGEVHAQIGLEPRWYLGAYSLYFSLLTPVVCEASAHDTSRGERTLIALQKLLSHDSQLAMEAYIERNERQLDYLARELAKEGRQLERDLETRTFELRRTVERARAAEALASLGTLVAGLAHEIGTPMGVIQGHAKMLESAVRGDDARWRLQTIREQIARISRIMQTLLNIARPGKARRAPVALAPLLGTTLAFVSDKLARRGIRVEKSFAPVPSITGDAERLQQLFLNLVLNAADAMEDGGVLGVRLAGSPDQVEVRVSDTGKGIASEDLERIFEPFYTTKEAGQGNGLGLVVADNIVSDHGGAIEVESAAGDGTTFVLRFPVPAGPGPKSAQS